MPVYEYAALDAKGKSRSGIIDAESSFAARQKLRDTGMYPVDIRDAPQRSKAKEPGHFSFARLFGRVRAKHVSIMTRQLSILVGAGLALVNALGALIPQTPDPALKRVLAQIKDAIVEGNSFGNALAMHPGVFPPLYVNMVRAGEASGAMEVVLERLADLSERQETLKRRIRSAMAYPVMMGVLGTVVLFVLITYIIPSITSVFEEMNQALPAITRMLIRSSEVARSYWWAFLLAFAAFFVLLVRLRGTPGGRSTTDRLVLGLPVAGPLVLKISVARFARTLGSLLQNGVSLIVSLDIVKNVVGNTVVAKVVEQASEEIGEGRALWEAVSKSELFPPICVQMIQVGEQSGELEAMLHKMADIYEQEAEASIMSMTSMLEPLMLVIMGAGVGIIVISILLPIFEMSQLIR